MSRIFDSVLERSYDTTGYDIPLYEGYDAETGGIMACAEACEDMVGVYESLHNLAMMDLAMEGANIDVIKAAWSKDNKEAKKLFKDGLKLLNKKKYGEAKEKFNKAKSLFDGILKKVKEIKDTGKSNTLSQLFWCSIGTWYVPFRSNWDMNKTSFGNLEKIAKKSKQLDEKIQDMRASFRKKMSNHVSKQAYGTKGFATDEMMRDYNFLKAFATEVLMYNIEYLDELIKVCDNIDSVKEFAEYADIDDIVSSLEESYEDYDDILTEAIKKPDAGDAGKSADGIFEKIKRALMNLWGKLQNFFANVARAFNEHTMSTKRFLNKYAQALREAGDNGKLKGFSLEMYDYSVLNNDNTVNLIKGLFGIVKETVEKTFKKVKKMEQLAPIEANKGLILSDIRKEILGKKVDSADFKNELQQKLRGSKTKMSIDSEKVIMRLHMGDRSVIKDVKKNMDSAFKSHISNLKTSSKVSKDSTEAAKFEAKKASVECTLFTQGQATAVTAFNVWKSVTLEQNSVLKSYITKALAYANKTIKEKK